LKELDHILRLWTSVRAAGESAVLATVVWTRGSSYRSPGAHLLVARNGRRAGSVSGGCLEDDLVKKAWWLTENGPTIRRYDTTADGEISTGEYGLGCNGTIDVLLERVVPEKSFFLDLVRDVREQRRSAAVSRLIEPRSSAGRMLTIGLNGSVSHNLTDAKLASALEMHAREAIAEGPSRHVFLGDTQAFVETLAPAVRLVVFGAGDDAIPLTEVAKYLGWQVFVFDGRTHYATVEKFPSADAVSVRRPGEAAAPIDPWTVAVIMNHSYSQDLEVLTELSSIPIRYLGILGPRKRTVQLLADAGFDESSLAPALHSPMGLDIGAEGPEQVALAVVAEIQAALHARQGGPLREHSGPIHARDVNEVEYAPGRIHSIACA
jgi:xanthine/CO dehydrogenase XdhC/CoxF family maturation factor